MISSWQTAMLNSTFAIYKMANDNNDNWKQRLVNFTIPSYEVVHYEMQMPADPWYREMTGDKAYVPDYNISKRLIMVYANADIASIPFWEKHEEEFEGNFVFRISGSTRLNHKVDVMVLTLLPEKDVELMGLTIYTNWQIEQAR